MTQISTQTRRQYTLFYSADLGIEQNVFVVVFTNEQVSVRQARRSLTEKTIVLFIMVSLNIHSQIYFSIFIHSFAEWFHFNTALYIA